MIRPDPRVVRDSEGSPEFDLCGYSERGMINALFSDISVASNDQARLSLLGSLLAQCAFPNVGDGQPFQGKLFRRAKIRVEQSFSDFGDLDALILLEEDCDEAARHAVFIEAKVKTSQRSAWFIRDEWREFLTLLAQQKSDSNLFMQLYRKLRLTRRISSDVELELSAVPSGWSLGTNPVVEHVWKELSEYCCENSWYLSIVPDSPTRVAKFFAEELAEFVPANRGFRLPDWDVRRWGYICWGEVEAFCRAEDRMVDWKWTIRNFEYNCGQIYVDQMNLLEAANRIPSPLEGLLKSLSIGQRQLLRLLLTVDGKMKQGELKSALSVTSGGLSTLKSEVNKTLLRNGYPRLPGGLARAPVARPLRLVRHG
jgi:hypothetical protein